MFVSSLQIDNALYFKSRFLVSMAFEIEVVLLNIKTEKATISAEQNKTILSCDDVMDRFHCHAIKKLIETDSVDKVNKL